MEYLIIVIVILLGLIGILSFLYDKSTKIILNLNKELTTKEELLNQILNDDEEQRKIVIEIKEKYETQFNLIEQLALYYNQMLDKMKSLDSMNLYEINDDFGIFFNLVKQSLYDIHDFYKEKEEIIEIK